MKMERQNKNLKMEIIESKDLVNDVEKHIFLILKVILIDGL